MLAKQEITPLELEIWSQKFKEYEIYENERLRAGFRAIECEKEVEIPFCGIKIKGSSTGSI